MVYVYIGLIILLNRIPKIGDIFKKVSTMFHELGHALFGILTRGRVQGIQLFSNNAGTANVQPSNWLSKVLMTVAGYPVETIMSFVLLYLYVQGLYDLLSYVLLGATILTLAFIRNWYGFFWLIGFGVLNFFAYQNLGELWVEYYFLAIVLLVIGEAFYSSFVIFVLSFKHKKGTGDTAILAQSTWIPAFIWGTLFFGFSCYMFYIMIDYLQMIEITKLWE